MGDTGILKKFNVFFYIHQQADIVYTQYIFSFQQVVVLIGIDIVILGKEFKKLTGAHGVFAGRVSDTQ